LTDVPCKKRIGHESVGQTGKAQDADPQFVSAFFRGELMDLFGKGSRSFEESTTVFSLKGFPMWSAAILA
jgi:hypothetical protein